MREIKFRAWHKFSEEIIPVVSIDFENQIINSQGPWRFFSEVELMQYTGLKDKNGVEIYEGDVIEGLFDYGPGGMIQKRSKVYFNPIHGYQWEYWSVPDIEVIGNIYEHPHLLEESQ